jgi:hypothetical protein
MEDNNKLDTLSGRMNDLKARGYEEEFKMDDNKLESHDAVKKFSPEQICIQEHYRFEGESDPGDMTILYAIETEDGTKGVFIDGFGTYSNPKASEFFKKVHELHKGNIY